MKWKSLVSMQPLELSLASPLLILVFWLWLQSESICVGCLATAGNQPSGDNTKGKCNKSLAEIGKILYKRGRPSEKEALREQERDRDTVKKSWSTGAWLSTLTDFQAVTVLCVGHFVLGLVSFFAKLLGSDFIFPPPLSLSLCLALAYLPSSSIEAAICAFNAINGPRFCCCCCCCNSSC